MFAKDTKLGGAVNNTEGQGCLPGGPGQAGGMASWKSYKIQQGQM